jgi:hypothetical protein
MRTKPFDPIATEQAMVQADVLKPRVDSADGPLGDLELFFTEHDPRMWALWRISMVRQFDPRLLRQLPDEDLLFLAGQTPEGYSDKEVHGIQIERNKISQNAERARVELHTRTARAAWRRNVALGLGGVILGAVLAVISSLATQALIN